MMEGTCAAPGGHGGCGESPIPQVKPIAVSYTHLTLPTKRIV